MKNFMSSLSVRWNQLTSLVKTFTIIKFRAKDMSIPGEFKLHTTPPPP